MIVAGIDVGLTGGVAVLDTQLPSTATGCMLPLMQPAVVGKAKGDNREVDARGLWALLEGVDLFVVERVWTRPTGPETDGGARPGGAKSKGGRRQGGVSNAKLMTLYGEGRGFLKMLVETQRRLSQPPTPYLEPAPQTWKNLVLAGAEKDKPAAIQFAKEHYPTVTLTPPPKRKPQHGIADAVCLAHFGLLVVKSPTPKLLSRFPHLKEHLSRLQSLL